MSIVQFISYEIPTHQSSSDGVRAIAKTENEVLPYLNWGVGNTAFHVYWKILEITSIQLLLKMM